MLFPRNNIRCVFIVEIFTYFTYIIGNIKVVLTIIVLNNTLINIDNKNYPII